MIDPVSEEPRQSVNVINILNGPQTISKLDKNKIINNKMKVYKNKEEEFIGRHPVNTQPDGSLELSGHPVNNGLPSRNKVDASKTSMRHP